MDMMEVSQVIVDVFENLTNDWIETFSKLENQNGFMWVMAGQHMLPDGVNPDDPRVIELCNKAEKYYRSKKDIS